MLVLTALDPFPSRSRLTYLSLVIVTFMLSRVTCHASDDVRQHLFHSHSSSSLYLSTLGRTQ